jgi:hypothetical protein
LVDNPINTTWEGELSHGFVGISHLLVKWSFAQICCVCYFFMLSSDLLHSFVCLLWCNLSKTFIDKHTID